ncbi:hypothetical protein MKEN_00932900 [Mycena kentingensis (nom. inval.)]|nr:hypothetical protein MKEN_00932900 [Mycena kentingensis (nom. inval.)]
MALAASPPASPMKRSSHKKRHTKPCRYFQVGTCPLSPDDCDFAHVYSDMAYLPTSMQAPPPKQCKYWAQGNCTNGIWCQYKHGDGEDAAILEEYRHLALVGHGMVEYQPLSSPPVMYGAPSPWSQPPPPPASTFLPPAFGNNPNSTPYTDPSRLPTPSASPTGSDSASSEEFPADIDYDQGQPPLLPATYFGAGYGAPLSPGPVFVPNPYDAVYPMSPGPLSPVFRAYHVPVYANPKPAFFTPAPGPLSQPQTPILRATQPPGVRVSPNKLASYKTKPCRYFRPGSVCPAGDECTFIHAEPGRVPPLNNINRDPDLQVRATAAPAPVPVLVSAPAPPSTPTPEHQDRPSALTPAINLPPRPLSQREQSVKGGFFPISWRVIGGGVLCGDPALREMRDRDDMEMEMEVDFDLELDEGVLERPQLGVVFPSIAPGYNETSTEEPEGNSTTPTGRQRASSIPSTPVNGHMDRDVLRLFSAESPGGL